MAPNKQIEATGPQRIMRPQGRIDDARGEALAAQLETAIAQAAADNQILVVDLEAIEFIASRGLAALARAGQHARARGVTFMLARPDARLRELLAISGHDRLFTICDRLPQ